MKAKWAGLHSAAVVLLSLPSLASAQAGADAATTCSRVAPAGSVPFDTMRVGALAGTYDLVLMDTTRARRGAKMHSGRLDIWVPDSTSRVGATSIGSLQGAYDAAAPDTGALWRRIANRDPASPGVNWGYGSLRLGDLGDPAGFNLFVGSLSPTGFRGSWKRGAGIGTTVDFTGGRPPETAGYFCARRRG